MVLLSANRDTRSTGGACPEIIDQNAAILGVGANYRPWEWPIYLYLEVGGSYDLIDLNRDKFRESINFGLAGYQEWYWHNTETTHTPKQNQNQYFAELYGNAASYSREDYNVIGDLRLRTGWNMNRDHFGNVQAYLKLHTINDSNNEFYNNLAELGPELLGNLKIFLSNYVSSRCMANISMGHLCQGKELLIIHELN
jgi:hypothetical protein